MRETYRKFTKKLHDFGDFFSRKKFKEDIKQERTKKYGNLAPEKTPFVPRRQKTPIESAFRFVSTYYSKSDLPKGQFKVASLTVFVTLVGLSGYLFFESSYFRVSPSKVIIERLDFGSDVNVAYKSIEPFYGSQVVFMDTAKVSEAIVAMQKNIEKAVVTKLYPNGLKIVLSSRAPEFVTYFPELDRYYGITNNGILVYEKSKKPELPILDIIDPALQESGFLDYREGISKQRMETISKIKSLLKEILPGIKPIRYTYFKLEQELHVSLESGTRLIFSLDGSENRQIAMLGFWNSGDQGSLSNGGVSYVDLRIPAKVFVCREESVCKKNLIRIYGEHYKK